MKNIVVYFLVSVLAILFGGVILGYILDSFFAGKLEIGDAATWLAAFSTLGAAFGTIGTLLFLNHQHKQNLLHQERVWKKQEQSLDFARYREHKIQFEKLINALEDQHKDFYIFKDRLKLYSKLFPSNSFRNEFSDYKYKLNHAELRKNHPLTLTWDNYDKLNCILAAEDVEKDEEIREKLEVLPDHLFTHKIEHLIFSIASNLELKCNRTPQTGDLLNNTEVFANVFRPMIMQEHSIIILRALNEFCGLEPPKIQSGIHFPLSIGFNLLSHYKRDNTPTYNKIICGHHDIISIMFELKNFIQHLPTNNSFRLLILESFHRSGDGSLQNKIEDKNEVEQYLQKFYQGLTFILEENTQSEDIKEQAQKLLKIIET